MLSNYIRGGQIFLHKMRMLKQVWDKSLILAIIVAFLITAFLDYREYKKLDSSAGITYIKAKFMNSVGFRKEPRITAVTKRGIYSRNIKASEILRHSSFKSKYNHIKEVLSESAYKIFAMSAGLFALIMILWSRAGSRNQEKEVIKGGKIFAAKEASKFLKQKKRASDFVVGGMNLVKDSETSHILITGTTGTGKTTCMHELLPQIREKNQPAIVVDYTGQMTSSYADVDKRHDVVIGYESDNAYLLANEVKEQKTKCIDSNPNKSSKLYSWDFWEDVKDEDNLAIIANALFADKGGGYDEMWNNSSKQFFKDAVHYVSSFKNPQVADLYKILAIDSIKDVHKKLIGMASAAMFNPSNEKTAMSIRTNTIAFIGWMENFKETENKISISKWFTEKNLSKGNWLFFKSTPKQRVKLRAFYSMLLDLCMNQIMELGEDKERRIWMVIDELPSLRKLPSLAPALSEFRKYGGCIIASVQSPHQLFELYGQHNSYAMLDQFNTKFVFRTDENNFASYLCKSFGEVEYKEPQENYSYGSHEMRDGVSMQVIEKKKPLLAASDLANLENLEAYVKVPEKAISVAKIKVSYEK